MDNFLKNGKSFFTFALILASVGTIWLATSRAGGSYVGLEPSEIVQKNDDSAFGGSYGEFAAAGSSDGEYTFVPTSLEDWQFAPQNTYVATNKTRFVAVNGAKTGEGTSRGNPISLDRSISIAQPGDVIYLAPGTYNQILYIKGLKGTKDQPVVFTTEPGDARKAIITTSSQNIARIISSENIIIDSLTFDGQNKTIWGVVFGQSFKGDKDIGANRDMQFIGNEIRNNYSEATLKVRITDGIVVHNNYLHDGGDAKLGAVDNQGFGEGMYFGCGGCPAEENAAMNIVVSHNKIQNVAGEGIEFKQGVRDFEASDNLILDTGYNQRYSSPDYASCCYGGGIVATPVQDASFNSNGTIYRNRIGRVTAHGVVIGAGDTMVEKNLIWQPGQVHARGITNTAAREPFATINWFGDSFNKVAFNTNHTFGHSTRVLTTTSNYGVSSKSINEASITSRDITKHSNESSAFNAWIGDSF